MRSRKNVLYSFVNPQAKLLKCNQSFLTISGASSVSDILGKEIKDVFQLFQSDKIHDAVNSCLAHPEQKITIEIEVIQNDIQHHFEWIIFAEEVEGIINGVHLVGRNADLKKQAQKHLMQQARLLSFIEEAVIAVDIDLKVVFWNEAASYMHGIAIEDAIGKRINDLVHKEFFKKHSFAVYRKLCFGKSWSGQIVLWNQKETTILEPSI
ncbi:MAG TPA: PAS domain-containing protein, partial [Flavisolibacter sp.]|nr:PAS domain-containing protein [Flavisolibacter sp.]